MILYSGRAIGPPAALFPGPALRGLGEMIAYHLRMAEGHSFQAAPTDRPLFLMLTDIAARRHDVPIDVHKEAVETSMRTTDSLRRACRANPPRLAAKIGRDNAARVYRLE